MLQGADVLELIDGEPSVGGSDLVEDVGSLPQQAHGHEQDDVEVHDSAVGLDVVVGGVDTGDIGHGQRRCALGGALGVGLRIDLDLLRPRNLGHEIADRGGVGGDSTASRSLRD